MNSFPSNIEGIGTDWHNLSHHGKDPEKIAELALVEKAKLRRFNKFLNKLNLLRKPPEIFWIIPPYFSVQIWEMPHHTIGVTCLSWLLAEAINMVLI